MMRCATFEEQLFDLLDGRLSAHEVRALEAHAAGCERCTDLLQLAREDADGLLRAPDTLLDDIMVRTGGETCARARARLGECRAAELETPDPTLQMHLEHCADCAAVRRVLLALETELPSMAEADPGPDFIDAVMARTAEAPRLLDWWHRLLSRPRLALEGAYVGTLVVTLIFGAPAAAFTELPSRVMAELRQDRPEVRAAVSNGWDAVTSTTSQSWETVSEGVSSYVGERLGLTDESGLTERAETWRARIGRAWNGFREYVIDPLLERLRVLWIELGWSGSDPDDQRTTDAMNGGTHDRDPERRDRRSA